MPLISSATRFCANGQAAFAVGLQLQRGDTGVGGDVDDDASDLRPGLERVELARRACRRPPAVAVSETFEESVRITVLDARSAAGAGRGVRVVSVTPAQLVAPFVTETMNWLPVSKAPP